jgi:two-component system cell cycle sensor histidine kinase/response regulator CckA
MWDRFANGLIIDSDNWREGLFRLILRMSAYLGFLVYWSSLYIAIKTGLIGVAVVDTLALATIIGLFLFEPLRFRWRATIFCATIYILAVSLLVWVGPISQIYLFGFSIITAILLGLRAGSIAVFLSSATLLMVGYLGFVAPGMTIPASNEDLSGWFVHTLNFTLVNTVLTLAIASLLGAMNKALSREVISRISLEREHTLLRTLIDALPDVVFTKDTDGRFVLCNRAGVALCGREREDQLVGLTASDLFPPELAKPFHGDDLEVVAGRELLNREECGVDSQGQRRWYSTIKVPLRDAAGAIVGLVGISRDITAFKQAEAERIRLLAQLQLQIERMPLGYVLCDTNFCYTRWNPAAERMFGYSEAEVLGKHPFDVLVPAESQPDTTKALAQLRAGQMDVHGFLVSRTKSGEPITCEWHNTPLFDEAGVFCGLLSLAQDVSERKKLEEQLRQSQKMEAIGQLAGGIAHDFNNLLTVISGHCELMDGQSKPNSTARDSVQSIRQAGERAASLTRQLLAFSRQTILRPKVLDLNRVVTETSGMLRRLIGEDILFATKLAPELGRVRVDPGHLDQVLINLAVNARDAMPGGGTLTFETAQIELSAEHAHAHLGSHPGPHVMLAVSDTGCGMTPEVMARVFEPFFTTKGVGKGTGLGLSMVFGIVRQSDGSIEVSSKPGHGSTFKIYFPIVVEPSSTDRALSAKGEGAAQSNLPTNLPTQGDLPIHSDAAAKSGGKGTETILLVEDDEGVRVMAQISLEIHGYKILTATDGRDALQLLQACGEPIDLLLTDVMMPHLNGPDLAEAAIGLFPTIKVLFVSGYAADEVIREGLLKSEWAFLQKPYSPLDLAKRVRQILEEEN